MTLVNAFGAIALDQTVQEVVDKLDAGVGVTPENITGKFRDSFESFTPGVNWDLQAGDGDLVLLDGNAVSASYLAISKDPLATGTETRLTYTSSFPLPIEVAVGLSMSQRVLGQELSMEVVSTEESIPAPADKSIQSIGQNTGTLYVNTVEPHNLSAGMRVGISGVTSDSRLNYPSLVVSQVMSTTSFYCTAGPSGNLPSLTVGPYTEQGVVYVRSAMGGARNGISEVFENTSTGSVSVYTRSASGDALPTGVAGGNHSITSATTVATQAIGSPYTYAFLPGSEFRLNLQADRAIVYDSAIDSTSAQSARLLRSQVVPDAGKLYTLRFRMTNNKALTTPTAKIVSVSKSGSTTATVTTDVEHGLTTGDYVVLYGIRNQTSFANLTTPQVVASTPSPTTFTVSFGASATAVSYGGMVARVNGANVPASFSTVAVQSALTAGLKQNELQLTGSGNWTWLIGDYVNVYGVREEGTGTDLGVDGVYRVVDVSSTALRLAPINPQTALPYLVPTNCGGTVIRRTDARIAFARIFEYVRERVELLSQPTQAAAAPVFIAGGTIGSGNITPTNLNTFALLSSTSLTAGAAFTGTSTNAASSSTSASTYFTAVNVSVVHAAGLSPGTLYFEVGSENSSTAPTTWYTQFVVPVPSNGNWQTFTFPLTSRWYRVRFVNGSTSQTVFRLATMQIYNGALGNQLTFPDLLLFAQTATALTAGATFTGPTLDFGETNRLYRRLTATAFADQASGSGGFRIQLSRNGTDWRDAEQVSAASGTLTTIAAELVYRYARVAYTNGPAAQAVFNLDCQASA